MTFNVNYNFLETGFAYMYIHMRACQVLLFVSAFFYISNLIKNLLTNGRFTYARIRKHSLL